jgi:hypothetical protein
MPYTTTEQIRSHLASGELPVRRMTDQALLIDTNDAIPFFGGGISAGSLIVKGRRARSHTRFTTTVSVPLIFSAQPVVPDSVVVASDSSLGQVFVESVDYLIDHAAGRLVPREGGLLVTGSPVTIWLVPYTLFAESSDYHVDLEAGEIRRTSSGDIALSETIYLDFTPVHASFVEGMINSAVTAANGLIERTVDPNGQFEADPVLGLAATYSALEILCRSAAARDLSHQSGQDRTARAWMQLASDYAVKAEQLVTAFRPPITPMSSPTIS